MPTALAPSAQRFKDIGSTPDAAIQEHRNPIAHCVDNFGESFDRGAARFSRPASVIGNHDAVNTMFETQTRIFVSLNPFDEQFARCRLSQAIHHFPGRVRVPHPYTRHADSVIQFGFLSQKWRLRPLAKFMGEF